MIVINGKFLTHSMNGQVRVATEIIKELDNIVDKDEFIIVAPASKYDINGLNNIEVLRIGKGNPHLWEQTVLYKYLKSTSSTCLNFFNTHPFLKPDITYIHDVLFDAIPNIQLSHYGKIQKLYTNFMIKNSVKHAKRIITVSEFTKNEILKYYRIDPQKIEVVYNGWQHMSRIEYDDKIFERFKNIRIGNYILAVSGLTPQKNFEWILKNAEYNPELSYVIVGETYSSTTLNSVNNKNILFTGRVTDEEMKSLMHNCKAFVHPAVYEGFGMTPLEAVAAGAKELIIANSSCLPEIYKDYVHYIDPYNPDYDLIKLLAEPTKNVEELLSLYSWKNAAKKIYSISKKIGK